MAEPAHPSTCVCYDCLPGGRREHRVRPWPATAGKCEHPVPTPGGLEDAPTRLVLATLGGGTIEQCRLCGTILPPTV